MQSQFFSVSVIIPVYNAEKYVRKAVESAVHLKEVGEVILVEDCSPDNALEVCKLLELEFKNVKLYQHPGGRNRGAGASRNLGIEKAMYDYIAFLDADDYFLPERFLHTKISFERYPDADGIYEAIGHFRDGEPEIIKLYSINKKIDPRALFHYLLRGTYGHFHTLGVTLRKNIFAVSGVFNTSLRLHQDAELWLRLAYHARLYPGNLTTPVSMVRKHDENRITHASKESKLLYWQSVLAYFHNKRIGLLNRLLIIRKVAKFSDSNKRSLLVTLIRALLIDR